ncbi:MAG: hypothetical protein U1B30_07100 [Pseudomonadota bacterium]|nr:hypothetical protein [Pseudomonadota bacterium]
MGNAAIPTMTTSSSWIKLISAALFISGLTAFFIFANLGQSLGRNESLQQLISLETLLAFGLPGLLPVVLKKLRNPVNEDNQ